MVKRAHELADLEREAEVPYEATRLARRAPRARGRLGWLLAAGAAALVLLAAATRGWGWLLPALAAAAAAWGVRAGRLGGIVGAGLLAVLGVALPLALFGTGTRDGTEVLFMALFAALGVACLPDLVTLLRDAELQHAYGRWARRQG